MPRAAKPEKADKAENAAIAAIAAADATGPAFEEALAQLEALVEEMESDEVPLEALIRKYEEGTRLYHLCEKRLDEARGRIEILRKKRDGETVWEPFGEAAGAPPAGSGALVNDGELF